MQVYYCSITFSFFSPKLKIYQAFCLKPCRISRVLGVDKWLILLNNFTEGREIMCVWWQSTTNCIRVAASRMQKQHATGATGGQSPSNCTRVANSRMQKKIVPAWPPVAGKVPSIFFHFACNQRPQGHNLHATGGHSGTICMRLAATWLQFECDRITGYTVEATQINFS